jgi:predicted nucleotidyltransferase
MRQAGLLDNEIHWHGETPVVSSSPGLTLVAFGSSARGSAHATSDVDLLVLLEGRETSTKAALRANERAVLDAAADASMESPRPLQVKVIHARDFATLPKEILGALSQDGLIVHDSAAHSPLWQIVYGGERA